MSIFRGWRRHSARRDRFTAIGDLVNAHSHRGRYEINPATHTLFQSGSVTSSTLFSFNGAISPDRKVTGSTRLFGSNMVLGYNTSSSGQRADFRLDAKVGSGAESSPALIVISNGSCTGVSVCRWGLRRRHSGPGRAVDLVRRPGLADQPAPLRRYAVQLGDVEHRGQAVGHPRLQNGRRRLNRRRPFGYPGTGCGRPGSAVPAARG